MKELVNNCQQFSSKYQEWIDMKFCLVSQIKIKLIKFYIEKCTEFLAINLIFHTFSL
jgi:hypothetical protein